MNSILALKKKKKKDSRQRLSVFPGSGLKKTAVSTYCFMGHCIVGCFTLGTLPSNVVKNTRLSHRQAHVRRRM
jgi:hypothetical protein